LPTSSPILPLFVDLDGTLIKSDLLFESLLLLIKSNPFSIFLIPLWLCRGRAYLKYQLAQRVELSVDDLPLNPEFHAYLTAQHASGRSITLISASNQDQVKLVGERQALFQVAIGSDRNENLKAESKLRRIQQITGDNKFAYAGNSSADIPVWREAREVLMVNCPQNLRKKLAENGDSILCFDSPGPHLQTTLQKLLQAMRPHQWLKNGLIFLPLILSHQLDQSALLLQAAIGFVSFCLCASSVYLLNDMFDINSDRRHQSKRRRPIASGQLSLSYGFIGAPLLLLAAVLVATALPADFLQMLLLYWLITSLYSLYFKRLFLLDTVVLAILYTWRIMAGSAAISISTTFWLILFSLFLFLGLALVKRYAELMNLKSLGKSSVEGRAYRIEDLRVLSIIGIAANLAAVLVFTFYINASDTTNLYDTPIVLWLICPLLIYLLGRIWKLVLAGKLDEDPVIFAIGDYRSQTACVVGGIRIWLAL